MKLLVTGASGFLGRHIVAQAVQRGHDVRAQVRPVSSVKSLGWEGHPKVEVVRADLRSKAGLDDMVRGCDAVISNAACKAGDFYSQFAGTVITTENVIEAMVNTGVDRLVAVSTFSVYGFLKMSDRALLDEESPIDDDPVDRDEYAQTKLVQERLAREFAKEHNGKVTIVRPGVVYGKDNTWTARIGMELGTNRCLVVGGGTLLPITYVENCAQAIVLAAEKEQAIGQTYNIVDDSLPTHRQYLNALNRHREPRMKSLPMPWLVMRLLAATALGVNKIFLGRQAKIPSILRPAALHARCKPAKYTNKLLKDSLGWSPHYGLEEALQRSFDHADHAALRLEKQPPMIDLEPGPDQESDQEARTCA
jgi:nucleoside-diphosphate-sugar epimerase